MSEKGNGRDQSQRHNGVYEQEKSRAKKRAMDTKKQEDNARFIQGRAHTY